MKTAPELWAITKEAFEERIDTGTSGLPVPRAEGNYQAAIGRKPYTIRGKVAVVPIEGVLVHRAVWPWDQTYEGAASAVERAAKDPDSRAVVLRINSPGGTVAGVTALHDAVVAAGKILPVYVYTDATMASAAFWISSSARTIGAARTAQIGSIGVVAAHLDTSKALEKAGLKMTFITSGRYKAIGNSAEPLGDDARQYIQARIDAVYKLFVDDVATGRRLATDKAETWADGQVFVADEAKARGLVDMVAGFDEFMNYVAGKVTAPAPGPAPRPSTPSAGQTGQAAQFMTLVNELMASGMKKGAAMLEASQRAPEAHRAWLETMQGEDLAPAPGPAPRPSTPSAGQTGQAAQFLSLVKGFEAAGMKPGAALLEAGRKDPAGHRAWLESKQVHTHIEKEIAR